MYETITCKPERLFRVPVRFLFFRFGCVFIVRFYRPGLDTAVGNLFRRSSGADEKKKGTAPEGEPAAEGVQANRPLPESGLENTRSDSVKDSSGNPVSSGKSIAVNFRSLPLFWVAGVADKLATVAGNIAADTVFIAADGGNRFYRQKRTNGRLIPLPEQTG